MMNNKNWTSMNNNNQFRTLIWKFCDIIDQEQAIMLDYVDEVGYELILRFFIITS